METSTAKSSPIYIGIEGVALRHSLAVISDSQANLLAAVRLPHGISLHTTSRPDLRLRLSELIYEVISKANLQRSALESAHLCIGMTGVTFPHNSAVDLPAEFRYAGLTPRHLICTGDAEIIFSGLTQQDRGSAIICHMGSTAYISFDQERRKRFGGWGPVFGDEGSGYAMGLKVLRSIGREHDQMAPPSLLWKEVQEWLREPIDSSQFPSPPDWDEAAYCWKKILRSLKEYGLPVNDLRTAVFDFSNTMLREHGVGAWRSSASGFTVPLFRAINAGDEQAREIARSAAESIVLQHKEACKNQNIKPSFGPLVLAGGVIMHNPVFVKMIHQEINKAWPDANDHPARVIFPSDDGTLRPACGALLFALGDSKQGTLKLPNPQVIDNLRRQVLSGRWKALLND